MKAPTAASAQPSTRGAPATADGHPEAAARVPLEDWDLLFGAVLDRLRLGVAGQAAPAALAEMVLDCAQALERLKACRP